jgi:type III restriction enzyme
MPQATIDRLIRNSPCAEPARHWRYDRETRTFDLVEDRRPAGGSVVVGRCVRVGGGSGIRAGIPTRGSAIFLI